MPTTYVVQDFGTTPTPLGIVSPFAPSTTGVILVQTKPDLDIPRTVMFYPTDAQGGRGEASTVF